MVEAALSKACAAYRYRSRTDVTGNCRNVSDMSDSFRALPSWDSMQAALCVDLT